MINVFSLKWNVCSSSWQRAPLPVPRVMRDSLEAFEQEPGLEENFKSEEILRRMTLPVKSPSLGFVMVVLFNVWGLGTWSHPHLLTIF